MLTLFSTLVSFLAGGLPKLLDFFQDRADKMHELALHGWAKVALDTLARLITRRTEPHVKLH
mgnify:CR=1 FL=1